MKSDMKTVNRLAQLIDEVVTAAIYLEHGASNGLDPDAAAILHNEGVKAVYNTLVDVFASPAADLGECEVCHDEGWFDPYGCCYQIPCPCREERNGNCPLRKDG